MRARNIKPGLYKNDELAECSIYARWLFTGLWCMADKLGRLEDRPKRIKAEVLPYDDVDVDALLTDLADHGFIQRYGVDGEPYIQVLNFTKHQRPHSSEVESVIPPPNNLNKEERSTKERHTVNQGEPGGASTQHSRARADSGSLIPSSLNDESLSSRSGISSQAANAPSTEEKIKPEYEELAALLDQRKRENNPEAKPASDTQRRNWANDVRLMVEQDKRSLDQIRAVLEWSQADEFWRTNVLSMGKFRKQFDQLALKSGLIKTNGTRSPPKEPLDSTPLQELSLERKAWNRETH